MDVRLGLQVQYSESDIMQNGDSRLPDWMEAELLCNVKCRLTSHVLPHLSYVTQPSVLHNLSKYMREHREWLYKYIYLNYLMAYVPLHLRYGNLTIITFGYIWHRGPVGQRRVPNITYVILPSKYIFLYILQRYSHMLYCALIYICLLYTSRCV